MFFILGITDGRKDFEFTQTMICNICGKYGRYQVFMTYTVLSLFFIPCFKWNKHYYVQTSCCGTLYELDPKIGKQIARGEQSENRLREVSRWRFCHNICRRCVRVAVGIDTNAVHSAGMRRQKILNSVRSVENDFRRA